MMSMMNTREPQEILNRLFMIDHEMKTAQFKFIDIFFQEQITLIKCLPYEDASPLFGFVPEFEWNWCDEEKWEKERRITWPKAAVEITLTCKQGFAAARGLSFVPSMATGTLRALLWFIKDGDGFEIIDRPSLQGKPREMFYELAKRLEIELEDRCLWCETEFDQYGRPGSKTEKKFCSHGCKREFEIACRAYVNEKLERGDLDPTTLRLKYGGAVACKP